MVNWHTLIVTGPQVHGLYANNGFITGAHFAAPSDENALHAAPINSGTDVKSSTVE